MISWPALSRYTSVRVPQSGHTTTMVVAFGFTLGGGGASRFGSTVSGDLGLRFGGGDLGFGIEDLGFGGSTRRRSLRCGTRMRWLSTGYWVLSTGYLPARRQHRRLRARLQSLTLDRPGPLSPVSRPLFPLCCPLFPQPKSLSTLWTVHERPGRQRRCLEQPLAMRAGDFPWLAAVRHARCFPFPRPILPPPPRPLPVLHFAIRILFRPSRPSFTINRRPSILLWLPDHEPTSHFRCSLAAIVSCPGRRRIRRFGPRCSFE